MNVIDKQIEQARINAEKANKELQRLLDKKRDLPHMQSMARSLLRVGHGDAYVQSRMYASRGQGISIDDIVEVIADIKKELGK